MRCFFFLSFFFFFYLFLILASIIGWVCDYFYIELYRPNYSIIMLSREEIIIAVFHYLESDLVVFFLSVDVEYNYCVVVDKDNDINTFYYLF